MRSGWARCFLNHGVTSIYAVGGDWGRAKERSQQSDARTPRIYDSVGVLRHAPSMTQEQVRHSVLQWLQKKPDFATLGSFNDRNKQVYQWTAEEVHRAGLIVFGHTEHAPDSIRAGQNVVEHIWGFSQPTMSPKELGGFSRAGKYLHWAMFLRDWDDARSVDQGRGRPRRLHQPHILFRAGLVERVRGASRAGSLSCLWPSLAHGLFPAGHCRLVAPKAKANQKFLGQV